VLRTLPVALATLATLALGAGIFMPRRKGDGLMSAAWRRPSNGRHADVQPSVETGPPLAAASDESRVPLTSLVRPEEDRIVPVTRRRLRQQAGGITWPALIDPGLVEAEPGERGKLLKALAFEIWHEGCGVALVQAVREEDGDLRFAALRALLSRRCPEGLDVFREVLRTGSDSERSLAVDGLTRLGACDDLTEAFADRLETIAAKAVLACAETRRRSEIVALLANRVDTARRDAILNLLGGILE